MFSSSPIDLFSSRRAEVARGSGSNSVEDMGSQDFMALMIAQMENQDPTQPMDQLAFMSQLAQFGTVSGVQELNEAFNGLAANLRGNQAVQASSLVGRSVATQSNFGHLTTGIDSDGNVSYAMRAYVDMGSGADGGQFYVHDAEGAIVFTGNLPPGSGSVQVLWDGIAADGQQLVPGEYQISANLQSGRGSRPTRAYGHDQVISVAVTANNQIMLNLSSGRTVEVTDVKEFF